MNKESFGQAFSKACGVRGAALPQEKLAMNLNFNIVVTRQTKGEEINFSPPFLVRSVELLTKLLVGSALSLRE